MDGCGYCDQTKPEWEKLKNSPYKNSDNIRITDMNEKLLDVVGEPMLKTNIKGFPTLRYINLDKYEDYDDSKDVSKKDRSYESFLEWIDKKTNGKKVKKDKKDKKDKKEKKEIGKNMAKKKSESKNKKTLKKKNAQVGGKWSRKYKRSINCHRPRGFSQRQHCKYGRRK
jgi:phenylalanyl-tRNA synthetase alpha subunit